MLKEGSGNTANQTPSPAARWLAAAICITYGFAKINGSQFTVLDSELTRPLGEVSGFWLTWYYFGFSQAYGTGLALFQILSGILLVLPRTALFGAVLVLPLAANIVLIDVFYGVDLAGTVAALVLLLCVAAVIAPHASRLWSAILLHSAPPLPRARSLGALVFVIVGAFGLTWWTANYNNRVPTSIDGVWAVSSMTPSDSEDRDWRQVFFERNRAHLAVFRAQDGPDVRRHFEIDADGVVRVWEEWLAKGSLIMVGHRRSETEMELEIAIEHGGGRVVLRRVRPAL